MKVSQELLDAIWGARSILVTTHVVPDGDAIGSALAMKLALEKIGKSVCIGLSDPVPDFLRFLPGSCSICSAGCVEGPFDLALVLDCGSADRVGQCDEAVRSGKTVANVDHHATNTHFADINWVCTEAAATVEMVAAIIRGLGVEYDADIATCLFAGLSTDTGSFRYSNTSADTFRVAADLVDAGARPWEIAQSIYDTKPYGSLSALAEAILGIEFSCGGLIASMSISAKLMERHDITEGETEGFIGYARSIDGVEIAVALRELSDGTIRVGFRSKEKVDVAKVAAEFGGGGHVHASGCTMRGSLEEVKSKVLPRLARALSEAGYTWME
ncbi:MAG: bifunctional oligoribonuclease/PAP phosphatase NrnA [Firmicutes bacterium]|nr:bifunctional oligoribonuclease/PAP phosphatase NrnA [Bacillota bacterium]MDD4336917.1 bifunctional oligoribonuclease/PAP phosphatase NrnA [Bacillota bacterium]MDD4791803.1 bifunctional oligoribonuclease/PAP phosphatase NrnA [Bacillota bacterium]